MRKREFLDTLRSQLRGVMSEAEIEGHLHYYNEYISESIASGKTEAQVMEELGSPVMIARTLIDSAGTAGQGNYRDAGSSYEEPKQEEVKHGSGINRWAITALIILLLFLILAFVGRVIAFAVRFFVPIMVVVLVIAIIKSRKDS